MIKRCEKHETNFSTYDDDMCPECVEENKMKEEHEHKFNTHTPPNLQSCEVCGACRTDLEEDEMGLISLS